MTTRDEAVKRGIAAKSMLYDKGRQNDSQLFWIYDLAAMAPDGIAVECGVYLGGSLITWAEARRGRGEIIAVDNKGSFSASSTGWTIFLENLNRYDIKTSILEMVSWEAPAHITGQVAFCFIDSDHGENGIPKDIAVWPDKIMPGGIICFHDYDVWKPGVVVKREVDKWQEKARWQELGIVGSAIAFRKPK